MRERTKLGLLLNVTVVGYVILISAHQSATIVEIYGTRTGHKSNACQLRADRQGWNQGEDRMRHLSVMPQGNECQ
ncbi:hypothetical protein Tco_1317631 [Tanacetum coccineum]